MRIVAGRSSVDGVAFTTLALDHGGRFEARVETFALDGTGAAARRINDRLGQVLHGDRPEWLDCVLGALATGMMLYGISLVYGYTGSIDFATIRDAVGAERQIGVLFGLVFILAGLVFKISAAPFHMWTPDVYEGAPTPVTAFFAVAPKVATMALILRLVMTPFEPAAADWQQVIVFVSIASMAVGSFAAIGQRNFKRLMAYSSIGHMGFALVGLAAGTAEGVQGVVLYLAIYVAMTLGSFAVILTMKRNGQPTEQVSDFAGLSRTNPVLAFFFAMLLFSLAGVPPLAGFFAKFYVFTAAIKAGLFTLSVIGVLTSVVGAFYYLNIVKVMYFDEPAGAVDPMAFLAELSAECNQSALASSIGEITRLRCNAIFETHRGEVRKGDDEPTAVSAIESPDALWEAIAGGGMWVDEERREQPSAISLTSGMSDHLTLLASTPGAVRRIRRMVQSCSVRRSMSSGAFLSSSSARSTVYQNTWPRPEVFGPISGLP